MPRGFRLQLDAALYGLPGFVLAFAALPLYLLTPSLYSNSFGLPLAAVGLVLMACRLTDAITDPLVGRLVDQTQGARFQRWMIPSLVLLMLGFTGLMNPPKALLASDMQPALLAWLAATVVIVSLANSAAQLAHQSWAISRGKSLRQQARLIGWREGLTLLGVMVASVLAAQALVLPMTVGVIGVGLVALVVLIRLRPGHSLAARAQAATAPSTFGDWLDQLFSGYRQVFHPRYKQLLLALGINALANAIPASLFLFYVRDVLKLTDLMAGLLLLAYFSTAALSIPAWGWLMGRFGPRQCWRLAMLGSILAFFWATFLGSGDALGFGVICLVTGFALGAELIAPSLFIGRIIEEAGHREALEGQYFGLWNLLAKSALAAAAGLVLPALALTGYDPSAAIAQGTALVKEMAAGITVSSLSLFYAGLPCLLKLIALGLIPAFNKESSDALSHPVAHHPAR